MQESHVAFAELCDRSTRLIGRARDTLDTMKLDASRLPDSAFDEGRTLSIVLAGQYSAGKSTIVRALTGRDDIAVGRGITTEEATAYDWNGIRVVDTPGIATGLRPDHDEISQNAIADAEILMYVVTYEGFDSVVAEEFRKLIVDGDKAADTILVVNKMASANEGNTPEQRAIIEEDLAHATVPYTPEQLRVTFVDAKSYLRAKELEGENPRRARRLLEESNMDELFAVMDSLARDANVGPRLTRPLYLTSDVLTDAKAELVGGNDSESYTVIREGLLHERHILNNAISNIQADVSLLSMKAASEIRNVGLETSEKMGECASQEEANSIMDEAYSRVNAISEKCAADIRGAIAARAEQYQADVDDFGASFDHTVEAFVERNGGNGKNPLLDLLGKANMDKFVEMVDSHTIGDVTARGLKQYVGSDAHKFVRNFFNRLHIPLESWGAVKIARGINVAGKALGVAGTLFGVGMQVKDDIDADARMRRERESRAAIISEFNGFARQLEDGNKESLRQILKEDESFEPRLLEIREMVAGLDQAEQRKSTDGLRLEGLIRECVELIKEIHVRL